LTHVLPRNRVHQSPDRGKSTRLHPMCIGKAGKNIRQHLIGLYLSAENIRIRSIFLFHLTKCGCVPSI